MPHPRFSLRRRPSTAKNEPDSNKPDVDGSVSSMKYLKKDEPGLQTIIDLTADIFRSSQRLRSNRHAALKLCERLSSSRDTLAKKLKWRRLSPETESAVLEYQELLKRIISELEGWAKLTLPYAFLQQDSIASKIESFHNDLTHCLEKVRLPSSPNDADWEAGVRQVKEADQADMTSNLLALRQQMDDLTHFLLEEPLGGLQLEGAVNEALRELPDHDPANPRKSLSRLLKEAATVSPDINVARDDIEYGDKADWERIVAENFKDKTSPLEYSYSTATYRRCSGLLVKKIAMPSWNNPQVLERVRKAAENWSRVLRHDERYNLPIYGYWIDYNMNVLFDGYAYSSALNYIKECPWQSALPILRDAAKGLSVLHRLNIMHTGIRGCNIFVDAFGKAFLSESGLSHIVRDYDFNGHCNTVPYRWDGPEVLLEGRDEKTRRCIESDIWSFGMTVYELLARNVPYHEKGQIKSRFQLGNQVICGLRPMRPYDDKEAFERGLDDELWEFLEVRCWKVKPERRCSIDSAVEFLESRIRQMPPEDDGQHKGIETHADDSNNVNSVPYEPLDAEDEEDPFPPDRQPSPPSIFRQGSVSDVSSDLGAPVVSKNSECTTSEHT
ncbi:kinase-like protein [Heliocybe sulcata]|uniref:Kinase-like protein n=1 Tax=Heliocybe sulcata TaxID=5364 RepID=A0A5C3NA99_9AGAM|nr:kinase-like protein [Heliocybe sulcata]